MGDISQEQYLSLKTALSEIQEDSSAVVSVLSMLPDDGARFTQLAVKELRLLLVQGRLAEAEQLGRLVGAVLQAKEGGQGDEELADSRIHREALRGLLDGISLILAQDARAGISRLESLTDAIYCSDSLQWVAWLWVARAAADAGDRATAHVAAKAALDLAGKLDDEALSTSLCVIGEIELLRGDHDAAIDYLARAAESFAQQDDARGLATAWLARARVLLAQSRVSDGVGAAEEARQADPTWEQPAIFLAQQAVIAGDLDGAMRALEPFLPQQATLPPVAREARLIELVRTQRISIGTLAEYLTLRRQPPSEAVIEALSALAARHEHFLQLQEQLGWMLFKLGRDDEALALFQRLTALDLDPDLRGSVLLGLGCLANRRDVRRPPGGWVREAAGLPRSPSHRGLPIASTRPSRSGVPAVEARPPSRSKVPAVPRSAATVIPRSATDLSVPPLLDDVSMTVLAEPEPPPKRTPPPPPPSRRAGASSVDLEPHVPESAAAPARSAFTGDLQLLAVPDLLEFLKSSRRTGTLVVTSPAGIGAVQMRDGAITAAASPQVPNLGDLLLQEGVITEELLSTAAVEQQGDDPVRGKLLGAILVNKKLVAAELVRRMLTQQVYAAMRELVQWTAGRFAFEPAKRPTVESAEIDIVVDTQEVLMEVLRQLDEEAGGRVGTSADDETGDIELI